MDLSFVLANLDRALEDATIAELPQHYRGKVRDTYELNDGRRLMIASDRLSAFDRNLCVVPFKGQVLTGMARFWFNKTADICPNHVIAYPDPNVLICRNLSMMPVEVVVRGYLAGSTSTSILKLYQDGHRRMYGVEFPDNMAANVRLDSPIITPTTKDSAGGHDEPLTRTDVPQMGLVATDLWDEACEAALALFACGQSIAAEKGLILADTKYEFGVDEEGRLVLADEIHTPDSSRFWEAATYDECLQQGRPPQSFDKDVVRRWVAARCDPYSDAIPDIPSELVGQTTLTYIEAIEQITSEPFVPDLEGPSTLQRIRSRLSPLIGGSGS